MYDIFIEGILPYIFFDMLFPLKSPSEYVEIIFLSKVQIQPYMDMIFPFDFEAVFITSTVLVGIQT